MLTTCHPSTLEAASIRSNLEERQWVIYGYLERQEIKDKGRESVDNIRLEGGYALYTAANWFE